MKPCSLIRQPSLLEVFETDIEFFQSDACFQIWTDCPAWRIVGIYSYFSRRRSTWNRTAVTFFSKNSPKPSMVTMWIQPCYGVKNLQFSGSPTRSPGDITSSRNRWGGDNEKYRAPVCRQVEPMNFSKYVAILGMLISDPPTLSCNKTNKTSLLIGSTSEIPKNKRNSSRTGFHLYIFILSQMQNVWYIYQHLWVTIGGFHVDKNTIHWLDLG